jgi:hypothetical protein
VNSLYDIETQVIFGSFKEAQRVPYVRTWVGTRYARLWTSFEWAFKMVEATAMADRRRLALPHAAVRLRRDARPAR